MKKTELALIDAGEGPSRPRHRATALGLATTILMLAWLATLFGADSARRPFESRDVAERTLREALSGGNDEPGVKQRLVDLRLVVSRRPLDSKTRVAYASLLLGLSRRLEDLEVAAFHARRAAELAPVTLPVVRPAAMVLAHTGYETEALALNRAAFGYDAAAASTLLASLEPNLSESQLMNGLPASPDAWLAWSEQLRRLERDVEADEWLTAASRRWPDHAGVLSRRAGLAVRDGNWEALAELFPAERQLADEQAFALPLVARASLRGKAGDTAGAQQDIERALRLDPDSRSVQIAAGAAYEAAGDFPRARDYWNRTLFSLPARDSSLPLRCRLTYLLARLEDQHGKPAAALRLWRSLLELSPDHLEAQRRVDDLSGFQRTPRGQS